MAGLVPATHRAGCKSRSRFEAAWWVAGPYNKPRPWRGVEFFGTCGRFVGCRDAEGLAGVFAQTSALSTEMDQTKMR